MNRNTLPQGVASDGVREGQIRGLFDEIGNFLEPIDRLRKGEQYRERRHRKCRLVRERSKTQSETVRFGSQRNQTRWSVAAGPARLHARLARPPRGCRASTRVRFTHRASAMKSDYNRSAHYFGGAIMELHVPHGSIRSIRDFLIHIGIVTVGVIIALALSQLVEIYHRSRMAAETMEGFRREISFAETQVEQVMDAIPAWRNQIETDIAQLSAMPDKNAGVAPLKYPETAFQLIRKASWETAIATQVLGALPPEKVKGYELAYEELKTFVEEERAGVGYWYDLHSYGENATTLSTADRQALIKELRRYDAFARFLQEIGKDTLKTCATAVN